MPTVEDLCWFETDSDLDAALDAIADSRQVEHEELFHGGRICDCPPSPRRRVDALHQVFTIIKDAGA
jgi:hypothetical protein